MIDTKTVGKSIAQLRRKQQLTQQGLAAALNVSHQAVSKWENGVALPDMQTMLGLSRLFGVSIEEILNGSLLESEVNLESEEDDEAPATPLEEPSAPRIELKLDANPLNINLVQQADDVVARALENCEDEPEGAAEAAPETRGDAVSSAGDSASGAVRTEDPAVGGDVSAHTVVWPEGHVSADEPVRVAVWEDGFAFHTEKPKAEKTVTSDMSFDEVVRMAPFVSQDALEALLDGCDEMPEMSEIVRIAPFVSKETLGRWLARYQGGMDWDTLRRLAPFLSKNALARTILANLNTLDWDVMKKLAPFLSKDALAEILNQAPSGPDFAQLKKLAPFLSRDALADILTKRLDELDVDALISFAPFLSKSALGDLVERLGQPIDRRQMVRLARFLPREQMDRLVYRAMGKEPPKPKNGEWRVDVDLTDALGDLGSTISDAVHGAVREARDAIHSVRIDDVMDAVNSAMKDVSDGFRDMSDSFRGTRRSQPEPQADPAKERSIRIRNRIAEKAFGDGNWDWIEAHIDEVTGDTLKKILMNCAEAGHGDLLADHVERVELNSAEACRLAQTTEDPDVWEELLARMEPEHARRVIDYIAQRNPGAMDRFARFVSGEKLLDVAVKALREGGDLSEFVEHMDEPEVLELVKIAIAEGYDDMEALVEHVDEVAIPAVFAAVVEAGRMDLVEMLAERADDDDIPAMAEALARQNQWDAVREVLESSDDLDLSGLWPLALEQNREDVLDDIAAHADEATLRNLALELAGRGAFDRLDAFLEELDEDTLEQLLEKAMEASNWEAIDRIDGALNG